MPITILIPPETGSPHPTGPGFSTQWEFIGPIDPGSQWRVQVLGADESSAGIEHTFPAVTGSGGITLGIEDNRLGGVFPATFKLANGLPALLRVQLLNPSSQVVDVGNRSITYDTVSGVPFLQQLITTPAPIEGGFTETDRLVMGNIQAATVSSLPLNTGLGQVADLGIDLLQTGPPTEFLGESGDFILSGRGSIDRPSGATGIYAYGCRWQLQTAPPGLGKLDGVVTEYEQRLVQLALIKGGAGGFEYVSELQDYKTGSGEMRWGVPFPKRLEYDILPFCTIRFRWLLFLQSTTPPV